MSCLFGHNYKITDKRTMTLITLWDIQGTEVPAVIMHCTKCGKRKVVEA